MALDDTLPFDVNGYKVRMIFGLWWFRLFNHNGKNIGDIGPMPFAEVKAKHAELNAKGLADLERGVGGDRPA